MDTKIAAIMGLVIAFAVGVLAGGIYYSGKSEATWGRAYTVSEVVGVEVKGPQGEEFGKISDYVIDTNGRIPFAIVAYAEKSVAIPFGTLTYNSEGKHLVLSLSKERLDSAPAFDKSALANRTWVEDTYKYFGQAPYWSDAGMTQEKTEAELPQESPY
ncbi:MAG: PRC-barrel domain containing protein [Deltaproteobacteria bacterium]|nr:MAG: PRC-barrel domain containing protein [Deltaproteobacteria bacterium]